MAETIAPPPPGFVLAGDLPPPPPGFEISGGPHAASGPLQALQAGYQSSATGLMFRGKLPDVVLDHTHATWYEKALASAGQVISEIPEMVVGGVLGGAAGTATGAAAGSVVPGLGTAAGGVAGGIVGTGAGAFAVPAAIREAYVQALTKGEVHGAADFLDRTAIVLKSTAKEAAVGALTMGAGAVAGRIAGKAIAPAIGESLTVPTAMRTISGAGTAAELGTMVVAPAALEGKLPEPEDFLNAAIVLGGLKGATHVAGGLRTIWEKTGIQPEQVVADAKTDPSIKEDLLNKQTVFNFEPNVEGGQKIGNTYEVLPMTKENFDKYVKPTLGNKDLSFEDYKAEVARPENEGETPTRMVIGTIEGQPDGLFMVGSDAKITNYFEQRRQYWDVPNAYLPLARSERARAIVPGDKAAEVAASPFAESLPQVKGEPAKPAHVNYNRIETTDDVKLALAKLSQVYEAEITAQRRGTVSWEETSQEAGQLLADTLGQRNTKLLMPREPGTPAGAAEILARKQLTVGAAEAMMRARDDLLAKGDAATPEDHIAFLQAVERAAMIQQEFLGARAEAGRALNILKSTAVEAERAKLVQDVIDKYGKDPVTLATMLKQIDSPSGALKFARDAVKATTWEKIVEAWKASILSGPITHTANIMGNVAFAAIRVPVDAVAATFGMLHGGERVSAMEPIARIFGALQGTYEGTKVAAAIMRYGEEPGKAEQFRKAIEGVKGEVIRLPFRALSAEDALFRTMNEHAELYTLATRKATGEGLNPLTREFRERIAELVQNPTSEMTDASKAAGLRFTFNTPLGEKGQKLQSLVRSWHLEWLMPFIRTPGNIAKELIRMTPFAPLVAEWRQQAFREKGPARDRAMAELVIGTGLMTGVMALVFNDTISGQGSADPNKRRVMSAAGWQPYSVKIGDTYYNYQRLQPVGTLMGMAADLAEVWDRLDTDESDKIPKMLAVAFANSVTNQTFLQGITNLVNAASDPTRFLPRFAQQYAASLVPAAVGQATQMTDPIQREVNSMLDAIKARVPGARDTLLPKRDIYGQPMEAKTRLGGISPVTESTESTDKVRTEGARLGIAIADVPKKVHVGRNTGKLGEVEMSPEQKNVFSEVRGKVAHDLLSDIVNSPAWDGMPELAKQRIYKRVFKVANKQGANAALPPDERAAMLSDIAAQLEEEMDNK